MMWLDTEAGKVGFVIGKPHHKQTVRNYKVALETLRAGAPSVDIPILPEESADTIARSARQSMKRFCRPSELLRVTVEDKKTLVRVSLRLAQAA